MLQTQESCTRTRERSYRNVLRSTSLIGGASLVTILVGLVRTKSVAVLVGPAGVGLTSIYVALLGVVGTITAMGLSGSGVRAIAEAHGAGHQEALARTVISLRRTVWITGSVGALVMFWMCRPLSRVTFGTTEYAPMISVLGAAILLSSLNTGRLCLLQGTRHIRDLARVTIVNAIGATVSTVACLYIWGTDGIGPSLVATAALGLVTTSWFARGVKIHALSVSWRDTKIESLKLLAFGAPLMLSTLVSTLTWYYISALLIERFGLAGAGIWQAAFSLSGALVTFVLGAMATDYYPRLAAVSQDDERIVEEVNAQTEVSLLLAGPGLAATLGFSSAAIALLYSDEFAAAAPILRWSVYGMFARVVSWPLGYVLLAKGKGKIFFFTEAVHNVFYITAMNYCTRIWGLPGAGIAFSLLYLLVIPVNYTVAHALSGTRWSRSVKTHSATFGLLLVFVGLTSALVSSPWVRVPANFIVLSLLSAYCLRRLSLRTGVTLRTLRVAFGQST